MTSTDSTSINPVSNNLLSQYVQDVRQAQDLQPPAKESNVAKPAQNQQSSTVVKLSAEGRQLSRAEAKNSQSSNSGSNEPPAKKTAEPSGIRFMQGESKGGRVSTYA